MIFSLWLTGQEAQQEGNASFQELLYNTSYLWNGQQDEWRKEEI